MANVKFGLGQINNPTPAWAKKAFNIFFFTTSIITVALDIFTEIPPHIKEVINSSVIHANLFAHIISKMCGIQVPETN